MEVLGVAISDRQNCHDSHLSNVETPLVAQSDVEVDLSHSAA